jgi:hypothetical protein
MGEGGIRVVGGPRRGGGWAGGRRSGIAGATTPLIGPAVEPQLSFPVIGFWLSEDTLRHRHNERFLLFSDEPDFHRARLRTLRRRELVNMLLVDSAGRAWAVRKVWSVSPRTPLWMRAILTLFRQSDDIEHAVDYELEGRGSISFAEVQDRV